MDPELDKLVERILLALDKTSVSKSVRDSIKNGILEYKQGRTPNNATFQDFLGKSNPLDPASPPEKPKPTEIKNPPLDKGIKNFYA